MRSFSLSRGTCIYLFSGLGEATTEKADSLISLANERQRSTGDPIKVHTNLVLRETDKQTREST